MQRKKSVGEQTSDGSRVWVPSIVACFARFLSANEIACILRLVDKETSQQYANCKTARLSLPSPAHMFEECWGRPESFRRYTRKQRLKLLCLTAASGSIANLEVALDNAGLVVKNEVLQAAAAAGQLDVCKMLRARGCPWGDSLVKAARGGHRHVCEWMLASGCSLTSFAWNAAARGSHEGLLYWLMTNQVVRPNELCSLLCAAAAGLSLVAFQRLLRLLAGQQGQGGEAQQEPQPEVVLMDEYHRVRILAAAAASPTPDWRAKVEWLEGQGYPRTSEACYKAAACSPDEEAVSRLQWLHSRGYTPKKYAVDEAASHGNLSALRFLVEEAGVQPDLDAVRNAATHGHLAVLQYLHSRGLLLGAQDTVASFAAGEGHLPVVAWAVEALGATPDNTGDLLTSAAECGNLELMTWLRERGWTWGRHTIFYAAKSGCEEAVEWLVEQGCPLPEDGSAYRTVAYQGDLLVLIRCLHRLGCPWGPNQLADCINSTKCDELAVSVVRCLLELGCPVDWDEVMEGTKKGRTALLTWLGEERQRRSLGAQQQQAYVAR